jgi:hypothetical protein
MTLERAAVNSRPEFQPRSMRPGEARIRPDASIRRGAGRIRRGRGLAIASLAFGDLGPVNGYLARRMDADAHLRSADSHHRHLDVITDPKSFAGAAREN